MIVYRLEHIHDKDDYCDVDKKDLGLYSSPEKVKDAIAFYRNLPGFRDYPNGFIVTEHDLKCEQLPERVYELYLIVHDEDYDYEYGDTVSIHATLEEAIDAKKRFLMLNEDVICKCDLIKEIDITSGLMDTTFGNWTYGFVVCDEDDDES
ncbi:MAG: hypothetical protein ACI3XR_06585 [Eubacteriales bacterium]